MINKITYKGDQYTYPVFLFEYLYSYLFRFAIQNGIFSASDELKLDEKLTNELITELEKALRDLLESCYVEPTHKNRSQNASRYREIHFDDKLYIVDFRTNPVGNTAYGINLLLNWLKQKHTMINS